MLATQRTTKPRTPGKDPSPEWMNRLYHLSVEQYDQIVADGIFSPNDHLELLDGILVTKRTHHPPQAAALDVAQEVLRALLPTDWKVREQKPIATATSRPEPDLAIVRGPLTRYARKHPGPKEIGLVIEVADSTLDSDRLWKGSIYAKARLPHYWIINLPQGCVEAYTAPVAGKNSRYREVRTYRSQQAVPLILAGRTIAEIPVAELIPLDLVKERMDRPGEEYTRP